MKSDEMQRRWPNLFLVGAPKCGTTAMSHYLAGHPQIYMSEEVGFKEPAFFAKDLDAPWKACRTAEDYYAVYKSAPEDIPYWGEATTSYLYSEVAIPSLLERSPHARLIAMVRNPIEMVQAIYNQHVKGHNENTINLSEAWALQGKRLAGESPLPINVSDPKIFQYGAISKTGTQLKRALRLIEEGNLHVIVYDDFLENPLRVYRGVLEFLELEDDGRTDFPVMNRRKAYRYPSLHFYLGRLSDLRRRLHIPGGWGVNALIEQFNVVDKVETDILPAALHAELAEYFREDVTLLSHLLRRDLLFWLEKQ